LDKGVISRIYKELQKLNTKRTNNPFNKWANVLNKQFSKDKVQMINKYMMKLFTVISYKGNANQNDTEIPSHPVRMAIIKQANNNKCQ
jgi:type II secretory pathway component PulC